jgi:outer membrane protein assembly factor BamE (lipoprotein component of BamABCDE complex)
MKTFYHKFLLVAAFFGLPFLIAVVAILHPIWMFSGHGFDMAGFKQVCPGMTMAEVENFMGKPSIKESLDGAPVWTYNKYQKWCIGHIFFDRDGKVKEKEHDH